MRAQEASLDVEAALKTALRTDFGEHNAYNDLCAMSET